MNKYKPPGWYGVDLDGTLAYYDGWQGVEHIGEPIPLMVARVKQWLADNQEVKIMTARANPYDKNQSDSEYRAGMYAIVKWCKKHIGQELEITWMKDKAMLELWDDRCVQIIPNTGRRADGKYDPLAHIQGGPTY